MDSIVVRPLSITEFVEKLESEKGFSFARYGDGTFLSLQGTIGYNCDGAQIHPKQIEELEKSIRDETITHGIGDLALSVGRADDWLQRKEIDIPWYDANVMNTASHSGRLYPFIKWLKGRKTVFVGPSHVSRVKGFPVAQFIESHETDAFDQLDELQIVAGFAVERNVADTVLISIGPGAPALVSRIHRDFPYLNVVDTGSIWDPYVGKLSRKIHKKLGRKRIAELGRMNFGLVTDHWWR